MTTVVEENSGEEEYTSVEQKAAVDVLAETSSEGSSN